MGNLGPAAGERAPAVVRAGTYAAAVALTIAISLAAAADAVAARVGGAPLCHLAAKQYRIEPTEGLNTTEVFFLQVTNTGKACRLDVYGTFAVTTDGAVVKVIRGNPFQRRIDQYVQHGRWQLLRGDWSNWCGARRGFDLRAKLGAIEISGPWLGVPECLSRSAPSHFAGYVAHAPVPA